MASYTVKRQDGPHEEEKSFLCAQEAVDFLKPFVVAEKEAAEKLEAEKPKKVKK